MQKIYVIRKGKRLQGPYTLEEIKQKGIYETDVVWFEGIPDNTPALEIEDFKDAFKKQPPAYTIAKRKIRRFLHVRNRKKFFIAIKAFFSA